MNTNAAAPEIDVSVVLPVYNERGHLVEEIARIRAGLDASPYRYEIIVVDDASSDGSGEQLLTLEGIRLIRFAQNRGTGSARRAGTRAALAVPCSEVRAPTTWSTPSSSLTSRAISSLG